MEHEKLDGFLAFLAKAENFKNTLRTSYTSSGRNESSAEHSWRLCLSVMTIGRYFEGVDTDRLLRLAVIHDLGEAICGNTPAIYKNQDKTTQEREGMLELTKTLPHAIRNELLALWDEHEGGKTPEARIIKGLDKLETILQHNQGKNPADFDYAFNLNYGREHMYYHPLLHEMRNMLDATTQEKIKRATSPE